MNSVRVRASEFADAVVLITGASGGIGSATARLFGEKGARVVLHYNQNSEAARKLAAEIQRLGGTALALQADLADWSQIQSLLERMQGELGPIDVLVNNAGVMLNRVRFLEGSRELWRKTFDVNLMAVVACSQLALRQMLDRGKGCIINVSSISARTGGIPGESLHYGASKAALNALTRGLALEFAERGIRVNAIAPGVIDTPIHDEFREQFERSVKQIPIGRAGTPAEIADFIVYLASDRASFISGEVFYMTGGAWG